MKLLMTPKYYFIYLNLASLCIIDLPAVQAEAEDSYEQGSILREAEDFFGGGQKGWPR
jgi:hypothetical protein